MSDTDTDGGIIAGLVLPDLESRISKFRTPVSSYYNLEDLEKVLHHQLYSELRVAPEEHKVLITEPLFTRPESREKMTQILFENFGFNGIMFATQEFLSLLAVGKDSGIVVNCGTTFTSIVPIWKSNILRHNAVVLPVGGQDVTRSLKLLIEQDDSIQTFNKDFDIKEEIVNDVKEKLAYVALDYKADISKTIEQERYLLPDGQGIGLSKPLFMCAECLFSPRLFGIDSPGCAEGVNLVIESMEPCQKRDISSGSINLILTGSSTMFPGFVERLSAELQLQHQDKINIVAVPERKFSAWIGGSIWAKDEMSRGCWIDKHEYDEYGPSVIHSKCL